MLASIYDGRESGDVGEGLVERGVTGRDDEVDGLEECRGYLEVEVIRMVPTFVDEIMEVS